MIQAEMRLASPRAFVNIPGKYVLRFWQNVPKRDPDECWEWSGRRHKKMGYGKLSVLGEQKYAHRVSWVIHRGPLSDAIFVLHSCDNGACVNPAHLFLGDHRANMDDMVRKGRQAKGSRVRGCGVFQRNKTHCKQGHPYNSKNTRYSNGRRTCRTCQRLWYRNNSK